MIYHLQCSHRFIDKKTETEARETEQDSNGSLPPVLQSGLVFQRQQTIEVDHSNDNNQEGQRQNDEDTSQADDDTLPAPIGLVFERQSTVHNPQPNDNDNDNNDLLHQSKGKHEEDSQVMDIGSRSKPAPLPNISALRTQHNSEPSISPILDRVPTDTNPHGAQEEETRKILRELSGGTTYSGLSSPIRLPSTAPLTILPSLPARQQSHDSTAPQTGPIFQRVPTDTDPHGHTTNH